MTADARFWSFVDRTGDCWVWIRGVSRHGYGLWYTGGRANRKSHLAHRYAWTLSNGHVPRGMVVCHSCDNPPCVRPDHLFLGSQLDNIADSVAKNRHVKGERVPHAKLTDDAVREVRDKYASGGYLQRELAQEYGVAQGIISAVIRRAAWKHVS